MSCTYNTRKTFNLYSYSFDLVNLSLETGFLVVNLFIVNNVVCPCI